jgi:hypothetical protein
VRADGDPYGYFTVGHTYPETIIVAPGALILFFNVQIVFNLTVQANDTSSPPLFGNYSLLVTVYHVNQPPIWVSRTSLLSPHRAVLSSLL